MEKKLEMKELSGQDTFLILKILNKTNGAEIIDNFFNNTGKYAKGKDHTRIGMQVVADAVNVVFANIENAKDDINKLLANLCNVKVKEIEGLGFVEYNKLLIDFFKKEELKDFFTLISSLIQ